ncbi:MAG: ArsR family transcriptional regulator [Methanoregula sp.]|nr:MAG: ArsR family transcriptional regulator [Methanoregula sp.]
MHDAVEVARLLDILGNRNRRRIIELLRQKPCFVTEISETLTLSPKAVIEHLQMMEREDILSCQTDDRRRKYYYLANDISIEVSFKNLIQESGSQQTSNKAAEEVVYNERLRNSVTMLARMIRSHDQLLDNLEQINHDIETKLTDLAENHSDIFRNEREMSVIIALSHDSLTMDELITVTRIDSEELTSLMRRLERRGIVKREKAQYMLRGIHAE